MLPASPRAPASPRGSGWDGRAGAVGGLFGLSVAAGAVVASLDAVFSARARAGTDDALRLSVILPYVGVDGAYRLARAFGLAALLFAAGAVGFGLYQSARRLSGASVPAWVQALHRQAGLVTVVLVACHLGVPFASPVPPYGGWASVLAPFAQPPQWGVRTTALLSAGVIAFWLLVFLGPAYLLLGRRRRWWSAVHALTVVAYVLAVAHAFWLGSDLVARGPARVAVVAAQVPIAVLLGRWLLAEGNAGARRPGGARCQRGCRAGAAVVFTLAGGLVVLAGMGAAGLPIGGMRA